MYGICSYNHIDIEDIFCFPFEILAASLAKLKRNCNNHKISCCFFFFFTFNCNNTTMHGLKKLFHATAMQMKSKACSCSKHGKGKASLAHTQK